MAAWSHASEDVMIILAYQISKLEKGGQEAPIRWKFYVFSFENVCCNALQRADPTNLKQFFSVFWNGWRQWQAPK